MLQSITKKVLGKLLDSITLSYPLLLCSFHMSYPPFRRALALEALQSLEQRQIVAVTHERLVYQPVCQHALYVHFTTVYYKAWDMELLGLPFDEMAKSAPYRWVGDVILGIICKEGRSSQYRRHFTRIARQKLNRENRSLCPT